MADSEAENKCGFCMREGKGMEEPKILPCKHVHCLECLSDFYLINQLIQCPIEGCREVYEIPAANLPSYVTEDNKEWCDVCLSKEIDLQPADIYCTDCKMKYCVKHKETHDDILMGHKYIDIKEYKPQKQKIDIRTCDKHEQQPYSLGCKVCLTVFCSRCFSGLTKCQGEESHQLLPLDELVASLENRYKNILEREVDLEKFFKLISKSISDFDTETVKMLQSLHATRYAQLAEVKQKYDELEREFMANRQRTKTRLAEYMEGTVMSKWNSATNTRHRLEAKCKYSHEVDIVRAYDELYDKMGSLWREQLPALKWPDIQEIEKKDKNRDAEVFITFSSIAIESEKLVTTPAYPKSLSLLKTINLQGRAQRVYQHKGNIYVKTNNYIVKVDDFQSVNTLIRPQYSVLSVAIHKETIYVLTSTFAITGRRHFDLIETRIVQLYDLSGKLMSSWPSAVNSLYSSLTLVSDQLLLADGTNFKAVPALYTLNGVRVKDVFSSMRSSLRVLTAADNTSIIAFDSSFNDLIRIDINTEKVMWRRKEKEQPAITCYGRGHALLADSGGKLRVINLETGVVVHEFGGLKQGSKRIHRDGDTLAVASRDRAIVTIYKLSFSPCVPLHTTIQLPQIPCTHGPPIAVSPPPYVCEQVKAVMKS